MAKTRCDTSFSSLIEAITINEMFFIAQFPVPESDSWFDMFLESFQDTTVIVLIVSAVVSLIVGTLDDPSKGSRHAILPNRSI